jgi:hypothetical protein
VISNRRALLRGTNEKYNAGMNANEFFRALLVHIEQYSRPFVQRFVEELFAPKPSMITPQLLLPVVLTHIKTLRPEPLLDGSTQADFSALAKDEPPPLLGPWNTLAKGRESGVL